MKKIANIDKGKAYIIIPVENQVRELDPKLLLAGIAVQRGFSVIIGSHREVDFRIASFPRSLYLNKSMTARNLKMFRIMQGLGHEILTWDEEALVHLPAGTVHWFRFGAGGGEMLSMTSRLGASQMFTDIAREVSSVNPDLEQLAEVGGRHGLALDE